jgi:Copper resistance protein D
MLVTIGGDALPQDRQLVRRSCRLKALPWAAGTAPGCGPAASSPLATLRPPGGWRGPAARRLLDRFSPVALAPFCATVLLGGIQALQRLGRAGALLHTGYGQVLLLKLLVVAAMVPLSLLAWRRRLAPRAEAALVVGVVGLAALLAVSPPHALRPP